VPLIAVGIAAVTAEFSAGAAAGVVLFVQPGERVGRQRDPGVVRFQRHIRVGLPHILGVGGGGALVIAAVRVMAVFFMLVLVWFLHYKHRSFPIAWGCPMENPRRRLYAGEAGDFSFTWSFSGLPVFIQGLFGIGW